MTKKNLGPAVSHYQDPSNKAFETVVFQENKPLSSTELNLLQDVLEEARAEYIAELNPSGFLQVGEFQFGMVSNQFELNNAVANVKGWKIPLEFTGTSDLNNPGHNLIDLPPVPVDSSALYADFVYLEVWRALVLPDPSALNKPSSTTLYRNGNILSDHPNVNLVDDLKQTPLASETSLRVQIQHAIRSVQITADPTAFRDGYLDVNVRAQGPNAAPSTQAFIKHDTDPGLWVAGDVEGSPNAIAGTVDGYVYSIPIALVYRRNSNPFDEYNNGIGGAVIASGISDRPDNLFSDQVVREDVHDLRLPAYTNMNWSKVLERNVNALLDNSLDTWVGNLQDTGWQSGNQLEFGTKIRMTDSIVPATYAPNPNGGNFIRSPDGICKVFTDRPHIQSHVVTYAPAGTLTLDLTGIVSELPTGTVISDVVSITSQGIPISMDKTEPTDTYVDAISGLGTLKVDIDLELNINPVTVVEVEYEISYPGKGLSAHFLEECSNYQFKVIGNTANVFNTAPLDVDFTTDFTANPNAINNFIHVEFAEGPHREVSVQYHTEVAQTAQVTVYDDGGTRKALLPEYPYMTDPANPGLDIQIDTYTILSVEGREVTLDGTTPLGTATATYHALRALPLGVMLHLYYKAPAIQAIPRDYLPSEMKLEILEIPDYLYSGTASSGSSAVPYPYIAPLNQIPISVGTDVSIVSGERDFNAPGPIVISNFSGDVGMLRLPLLVPMLHLKEITLKDLVAGDLRGFKDHYTTLEAPGYKPAVFAQSLTTPSNHKVFLPVLCRLAEDQGNWRKGTLFLMIMSQVVGVHEASAEDNKIVFNNTVPSKACVSLYRVNPF